MERRYEARFIIYTSMAVVALLLAAGIPGTISGYMFPPVHDETLPPGPTLGVDMGYLDDTRLDAHHIWTALISSNRDMGVIWINNTGDIRDTYTVSVTNKPEGWLVSVYPPTVSVDAEDDMGIVLVTFDVPPQASGINPVNFSVHSQRDTSILQNMTVLCDVERTDAYTIKPGDTITVEYSLKDEEGNNIDSGTLPVTAGEKYVGPANMVRYIEGFNYAPIGMRTPSITTGGGETKTVRLPPELAYGAVPPEDGGHSLGGMVLLFTITILTPVSPR